MTEVPVLRLDPDLPELGNARAGDAGVDLFARCSAHLSAGGGRALVWTGISLEIPAGHAGLVLARSGLAADHGIGVVNSPGLIDPGYRGEIAVVLINTDPSEAYDVERGDRIAQLVIVKFEAASFLAATALEASERGSGGFGHSGR
ncbi:MAG: dUTP diphosphatase [Acidimicrobiales bacterium]